MPAKQNSWLFTLGIKEVNTTNLINRVVVEMVLTASSSWVAAAPNVVPFALMRSSTKHSSILSYLCLLKIWLVHKDSLEHLQIHYRKHSTRLHFSLIQQLLWSWPCEHAQSGEQTCNFFPSVQRSHATERLEVSKIPATPGYSL